MENLQLFGTVERDGVLASAMFTRDRRHNGEAIIHTWVDDPEPVGFAVVAHVEERTDGSLYLTAKRTYRATPSGALILPDHEREDLSQFSAQLGWSGIDLNGDWKGPGGGGAVRLKVPDQQTVRVQELGSWRAFKEWAGTARERHHVSVFRGHGNSDWRLQTSCTRAGLTRFDKYIDELLPKFRVRAEIALNRQFDPTNGQDFSILLGLAQHHGLPTPLLDWTLSPYIAAYFAFADAVEAIEAGDLRKAVRIYALDSAFYNSNLPPTVHLAQLFPYVSGLEVSPFGNPRLYAQQGRFLATNIADVESYLRSYEERSGSQILRAVDIPVTFANEALEDLAFMGLSAESMAPGLDGVCRALRHEMVFSHRPVRKPGKPIAAPTDGKLWELIRGSLSEQNAELASDSFKQYMSGLATSKSIAERIAKEIEDRSTLAAAELSNRELWRKLVEDQKIFRDPFRDSLPATGKRGDDNEE